MRGGMLEAEVKRESNGQVTQAFWAVLKEFYSKGSVRLLDGFKQE